MNNISRHLCLSFGISIAVQSLTTSLQAQETKPSQATKDVSSVVIKERFVDHIQPLLKEYWFDDPEMVQSLLEDL